jgi:type IV pilus biogenesis protein PilP
MADEPPIKCDLEAIEQLEGASDQMRQYELCADLMQKRLKMLQVQKAIKELSDDEPSVAAPSVTDQGYSLAEQPHAPSTPSHPAAISVSGTKKELVAELMWSDGSRATVRKGMNVGGYEILNISSQGVRAKHGGKVFDLPVGMPVFKQGAEN